MTEGFRVVRHRTVNARRATIPESPAVAAAATIVWVGRKAGILAPDILIRRDTLKCQFAVIARQAADTASYESSVNEHTESNQVFRVPLVIFFSTLESL